MDFSGIITAAIKTMVTAAVAALVAWLLSLGIDIGEHATALESALLVALLGATNLVLNWLSQKFPKMAKVISLGRA